MQDIKKWTLPFEKRCVKMVLRWRERKTTKISGIDGKVGNIWNR